MKITRINERQYTIYTGLAHGIVSILLVDGYWRVEQTCVYEPKFYNKFNLLDAAFDFVADCDWS